MGVSELDIDCEAVVTSITPCPEIAAGEGRVVTGRFVTRDAGNLVTVALANGTEIRATDIHPVWSVDREDWVPAGDLEPGELVDTLAGPVAVLSVRRLESALDVYNIEVHGEHVFRVTADGLLVHNAGPDDCAAAVARIQGLLSRYPCIIDPRTHSRVPFPSGVRDIVDQGSRVSWTKYDRAAFIAEWCRRGFPEPRGGWANYDIHHILPREFGGTNDFWNLVPVERLAHQDLLNSFWRTFAGL